MTDRPPRDPTGSTVAPGAGLPDDPALAALHAVVARARGVWICRSGEVEASVPLRRRLVDPPAAAAHDAGHAQTTWPLYHDDGPGRYDPAWRLAYRAVNTAFADAAAQEAARGATVWIHGHTLQLVPAVLRRRRPDLRIGFYLPTHFPSGETLRAMPMHREVLRGLLGADLVGFQTPRAAENFLRRCQEVTDEPPGVGVFPTSVQAPAIRMLAANPAVDAAASQLRARLGNPRTVVLGMNGPEPSQGVRQRLQALGQGFRQGRLDPASTVVVQVVLGRGGDLALADEIAREVAEHGATIRYLEETPTLAERVAWYRAADVLLATPLREGSTTAALEFAAAARDDAVLVLSELSGTVGVLSGAHRVNPHDDDQVITVLQAALAESREQREQRMARMRAYVTSYHTYTWAEAFLRTLRATPRRFASVPAPRPAAAVPHVAHASAGVRLGR